MQNKMSLPECPICGSLTYATYDEWGRTTMHIHCRNCRINVGGPMNEKTIEEFVAFAKNMKERHYNDNTRSRYFFDYSVGMVSVRK
jgi:hypothetical protein